MRNMLAFFAAMTLGFVGVGWYLNWFSLRSTPAPSGQRSVTVDFNTKKITEDSMTAVQKIQQKLADQQKSAEKAKAEAATPGAPAPVKATQELSIHGLDLIQD